MNVLYYYWITTVEGISLKKCKKIVDYFGGIEAAWKAKAEDFYSIGEISSLLVEKLMVRRNEDDLLKEIKNIELKGINIITIDSKDYPSRLKNIYDPPFLLYVKGKLKECIRFIGVVGSRRCTPYGRMVARSLSKMLCDYDVGIVSGMASGIDTEAHMGALDGSGFTCAVLGNGCDIVYPPENKRLMVEIENNGAVISEYPPGTRPFAQNFPQRNRIISGISDGILVVEAGERSGTTITANFALEQGREVFAVPGNILSDLSKGTNMLIKDGAKLVTHIGDILQELGIDFGHETRDDESVKLSSNEKVLLDIIKDSPIHIEDLIAKVTLRVGEINSILTSLEVKGIIKTLPGRYIVRIF